MKTFKEHESQVRSYIRSFPAIFQKAKGATVFDEQGKKYIDFFCRCRDIELRTQQPTGFRSPDKLLKRGLHYPRPGSGHRR
nr:hypothetical protein [Methanobacterium formicicum]